MDMSSFDENFKQSQARGDTLLADVGQRANRTPSIYRQLREIQQREKIDGISRRLHAQDSIESAIAVTPPGGSLSPALVKAMNLDKGIETRDGEVVDGQITEGGYDRDTGGYRFVVARKNPDGTMGFRPQVIPPVELYAMMRNRSDLFQAPDVDMFKERLQRGDATLTDDRLNGYSQRYVARRQQMEDDLSSAYGSPFLGDVGGGSGAGGRLAVEKLRQEGYANKGNNDILLAILKDPELKAKVNDDKDMSAALDRRLREVLGVKKEEPGNGGGDGGGGGGDDPAGRLTGGLGRAIRRVRLSEEYGGKAKKAEDPVGGGEVSGQVGQDAGTKDIDWLGSMP